MTIEIEEYLLDQEGNPYDLTSPDDVEKVLRRVLAAVEEDRDKQLAALAAILAQQMLGSISIEVDRRLSPLYSLITQLSIRVQRLEGISQGNLTRNKAIAQFFRAMSPDEEIAHSVLDEHAKMNEDAENEEER